MDVAELRGICLGFPGAFEDFPFGPETSVFKVQAAVSGSASQDVRPLRDGPARFRREPEMRACPGRTAARRPPGDHRSLALEQEHWNGVRLDGSLPDAMVRDMIEDSYDLVVASLSRRQQEQLGWARLAGGRA